MRTLFLEDKGHIRHEQDGARYVYVPTIGRETAKPWTFCARVLNPMLRVLLSRVRGTFRRSRLNEQLDDELREHLTLLQERFVRRGMDPTEAFYAHAASLAVSLKSRSS